MTDAVGTRPSRRRWLIVALTVSVALNLFFVGLIAGHVRRHHPPPTLAQRERFEHIANELGLNDTQRATFQTFQSAMRQHGAAMRAANTATWAKIADPATPPDQIPSLLGGTVKNRTEFQQTVADTLGKFLATLTPDQRATFVEEARNPGRHRR
jgi:uncharacterized membrane protein